VRDLDSSVMSPCLRRERVGGEHTGPPTIHAASGGVLGPGNLRVQGGGSGSKSIPTPNFQPPLLTPYTQLLMLPDPFTTDDGDVILRAGPDPGLAHDFRVHKLVLSLVSPVFKGLFQVAQPDGGREDPLPVVPITDSPENVDLLLRFVYPGRVPPIITDLPVLSALITIADKYAVRTVVHIVKEKLVDEKVLEKDPFGAYMVARRWGFSDKAKEVARGMTLAKVAKSPSSGDPQNTAREDFLRLVWFMQERGDGAKTAIRTTLVAVELEDIVGDEIIISCDRHNNTKCREFYEELAEVIAQKFDVDPRLDVGEMVTALMTAPNRPHGLCDEEESPEIAENFSVCCPLQPSVVFSRLADLASELETICEGCLSAALDGEFPI